MGVDVQALSAMRQRVGLGRDVAVAQHGAGASADAPDILVVGEPDTRAARLLRRRADDARRLR